MLTIGIAAMLCGCYSFKENQVEMKSAELVRIDTISRYDRQQQVLTWKSQDNVYFTSYAALGPVFVVGARVTVFVQK
jgi:hypothetical protein